MAYISAEDVAAIRQELKAAFPKFKFGVRKESGGLAVAVTIKQGTCAFEGKKYAQVNQYWIDSHWCDAEDAMVLKRINEIMLNAPGRAGGKVYFDHSDAQTDYFHTAFYTHLSIGQWDREYECVEG
jgi:hypothetical protein